MCVCVCVCMRVCVCECVCVHVHAHTYILFHINLNIQQIQHIATYIRTYSKYCTYSTSVHMYVPMCMYILCLSTYLYTWLHVHTYTPPTYIHTYYIHTYLYCTLLNAIVLQPITMLSWCKQVQIYACTSESLPVSRVVRFRTAYGVVDN